jgi:YHS domain-containing protein
MRTLFITLLISLLAGCASNSPSADSRPHGQCLVCKYNADLGCVDIPVDETTPRLLYQGKTYYFCSNECRDQFAKNPSKYAK